MKEAMRDALEEIKRVDHLIYVSLKYTRTVDVIRSILQRMMDSMECLMDANLIVAKYENLPKLASEKARILKNKYPDSEQMQEYLNFYLLIRKMLRAKYTSSQEFRRHVTMSITFPDSEEMLDVNIDIIHEYFNLLKEFFEYTLKVVENAEKEEEKS